jgi:hypothetical protein
MARVAARGFILAAFTEPSSSPIGRGNLKAME